MSSYLKNATFFVGVTSAIQVESKIFKRLFGKKFQTDVFTKDCEFGIRYAAHHEATFDAMPHNSTLKWRADYAWLEAEAACKLVQDPSKRFELMAKLMARQQEFIRFMNQEQMCQRALEEVANMYSPSFEQPPGACMKTLFHFTIIVPY